MYSDIKSKNRARHARAFAFGYEAGVNEFLRVLKLTTPASAHKSLDMLANNVKQYAYQIKADATAINKGKRNGHHERKD